MAAASELGGCTEAEAGERAALLRRELLEQRAIVQQVLAARSAYANRSAPGTPASCGNHGVSRAFS